MAGNQPMKTVLVATPARPSTPEVFFDLSEHICNSLTWRWKERALYICDKSMVLGKYGPNAAVRNELLDGYLRPHHTHVLWLDVDLVRVPIDLIQRLTETGEDCIAAPFVLMEPSWQFGPSRFYDVGGFVKDGQGFTPWPPFCEDKGKVIDVDSVGTCYLVPAEIYRAGVRYSVQGDEVEHLSMMKAAKEMGYRIVARRDVTVLHAYLPKYGRKLN